MQCENNITSMEKHVSEVEAVFNTFRARLFPRVVNDFFPITKEELEQLNASLKEINNTISALHDGFVVVSNMVPENPTHVFLNFDDSTLPEAALKKAIFDKDTGTTTTCVVPSGMGGVGKTSALRAIGNDAKTMEQFPDGVLYMSLGSEATKQDFIRILAMFVKFSGGEKECTEVENQKQLNEAICIVGKWFKGRNCLFLIDDIWCQNGIPQAVTQMPKKIVSNKDSRMAFTTRDRALECDITIAFQKRKIEDAENILMHSAGLFGANCIRTPMNEVKLLLEMSCGIPILLSTIGSRAKVLMENRKRLDSTTVWKEVLEEYEHAKNKFPVIMWNKEKDEPILDTLYLSVKMIGDGTDEGQTETLFRSFCILKKRQRAPTSILRRLRGMSKHDARREINKFERFSIVEIFPLTCGGHTENYFIVHDLFMDVSKHLAKLHTDFEETLCRRFISSYVLEGNGRSKRHVCTGNSAPSCSQDHAIISLHSKGVAVSVCESWIGVSDDGFVHCNLFRLLEMARMHGDGMALLRDPRWIAMQLKS